MPVLVANQPEVKVNGQNLDIQNLIEIVVEQDFHLPSSCLLTLHDEDLDAQKAAGVKPKIGDAIEVSFNQEGMAGSTSAKVAFKGVILAMERAYTRVGQQLRIQCYSKLYNLHVGRETKTYTNTNDQAMIQDICGAAGCSVVCDASLSSPIYEYVMRFDQTDWEFVRGRLAERGLVLRDSGGIFKVDKPKLMGSSVTVDKATLLEFNPRRTAGGPLSTVKVFGWDWKQKQKLTGKASSAKGDESATGLPKDASGTASDASFNTQEMTLTSRVVGSQSEADNVAKAALEQEAATFAEADGTMMGDATVEPGTELTIGDMGDDWNGKWIVSRARHVYNQEGFLTEFTVSGRNDRSLLGLVTRGDSNGPGLAGGPPIYGVVVAIVTDLSDPDKYGRVKVKFPTLQDKNGTEIQSWWVRSAAPVAGNDRGVFLPLSVNDEVLVAFERGDTRRPYIIGSLYNGQDKVPGESGGPDDYAKGGASSRWVMKSTTGNVILFEDSSSKNEIRIDIDKGAHTFVLSKKDSKITMHSDGKIEIDAKQAISIKSMDDITIESQKNINLKATMSIKMEATQNFEAKGTAGAKISSTATLDLEGTAMTNVKGAMVNLG